MRTLSSWTCPYCGHYNLAFWDAADWSAGLRHCDVDRGGCGGLTVVNVARVEVVLRVRRVEGEGAAEAPAAPTAEERAIPVAEPAHVAEFVPAEALAPAPEVAAISESARTVLGAEHVVKTPVHNNGKPHAAGSVPYRFEGFYNELAKMQEGLSFASLALPVRKRLVELTGKQIARHLSEPPTQAQWDTLKPSWMPNGASVATSYMRNSTWRETATAWHLGVKRGTS